MTLNLEEVFISQQVMIGFKKNYETKSWSKIRLNINFFLNWLDLDVFCHFKINIFNLYIPIITYFKTNFCPTLIGIL